MKPQTCRNDETHTSHEWWTIERDEFYGNGTFCTDCAAKIQASVQAYHAYTDELPGGFALQAN